MGLSLTGPCKHFFCLRVFGTVMLAPLFTAEGRAVRLEGRCQWPVPD
jgi:hypothetical protein